MSKITDMDEAEELDFIDGRNFHVDRGDEEQVGDEDNDSALGDDRYTYVIRGNIWTRKAESKDRITTSIASSVKDFVHENGRRYHAFEDDAYFLPNDVYFLDRIYWPIELTLRCAGN